MRELDTSWSVLYIQEWAHLRELDTSWSVLYIQEWAHLRELDTSWSVLYIQEWAHLRKLECLKLECPLYTGWSHLKKLKCLSIQGWAHLIQVGVDSFKIPRIHNDPSYRERGV